MYLLILRLTRSISREEEDSTDVYQLPLRLQQVKKPDRIPLPDDMSRTELLRASTATATRYGISSSAHLGMVASTVNAIGGNVDELVASLPTIKRHRKQEQERIACKLKADFIVKFKSHKKILHWDGKVTQFMDAQGHVYQDCNAVVISIPLSDEKPQFIGAPVVTRGTGQLLARAALHCVNEWEARESIIGTVFDTTSANTGLHEGAAVHIENGLGHSLLWLACRHHIAELHIKHSYDKVQGATKGVYMFLSIFTIYVLIKDGDWRHTMCLFCIQLQELMIHSSRDLRTGLLNRDRRHRQRTRSSRTLMHSTCGHGKEKRPPPQVLTVEKSTGMHVPRSRGCGSS